MFVNLDLAAPPLAEQLGDLPERLARYGIASLGPIRAGERAAAGELEDRRRQLPRGLPRPDRAPGADAAATTTSATRREVHDGYVWFEAPLRDNPAGTRMERLYRRLVRPMPGLEPEDVGVWRYLFIYPNTAIDLYPDQVMTWQISPDGVPPHPRRVHGLPRGEAGASDAARAAPQREAQRARPHEDIDLVSNVQAGLATRGYVRRARCRAARRQSPGSPTACGPTSASPPLTRSCNPPWKRVRRGEPDPGCNPPGQRPRADPRRRRGADRQRRHRRRADRPHRDGRGRLHARSSTTTSRPARRCSPRRSSTPSSAPATSGSRTRRGSPTRMPSASPR